MEYKSKLKEHVSSIKNKLYKVKSVITKGSVKSFIGGTLLLLVDPPGTTSEIYYYYGEEQHEPHTIGYAIMHYTDGDFNNPAYLLGCLVSAGAMIMITSNEKILAPITFLSYSATTIDAAYNSIRLARKAYKEHKEKASTLEEVVGGE